ncbi:hypothetical protein [Mycobacterium hubeiense]|uniref:hypothetical protein n=1 Tax=Mycobacterium hubeiense TaxID=1867256 RepID=UPI00115B1155|nr:hypothetical protein [Mycobacterium sp. QGD 101]
MAAGVHALGPLFDRGETITAGGADAHRVKGERDVDGRLAIAAAMAAVVVVIIVQLVRLRGGDDNRQRHAHRVITAAGMSALVVIFTVSAADYHGLWRLVYVVLAALSAYSAVIIFRRNRADNRRGQR